MIHYYFDSKAALWQTALESILGELRSDFEALEEELKDLGGLDGLRVLIRRYVLFSSRNPEISLILRNERNLEAPHLEWLRENIWVPIQNVPLRMIERAQKEGVLKDGPPAHILLIIVGACLQPMRAGITLQQIHQLPPDDQSVYEIHADLVVETLLEGLTK